VLSPGYVNHPANLLRGDGEKKNIKGPSFGDMDQKQLGPFIACKRKLARDYTPLLLFRQLPIAGAGQGSDAATILKFPKTLTCCADLVKLLAAPPPQ
jgi:hypothetical protein